MPPDLKFCVLYSYYSAKICFANHEKEKAAGIFPPLFLFHG